MCRIWLNINHHYVENTEKWTALWRICLNISLHYVENTEKWTAMCRICLNISLHYVERVLFNGSLGGYCHTASLSLIDLPLNLFLFYYCISDWTSFHSLLLYLLLIFLSNSSTSISYWSSLQSLHLISFSVYYWSQCLPLLSLTDTQFTLFFSSTSLSLIDLPLNLCIFNLLLILLHSLPLISFSISYWFLSQSLSLLTLTDPPFILLTISLIDHPVNL